MIASIYRNRGKLTALAVLLAVLIATAIFNRPRAADAGIDEVFLNQRGEAISEEEYRAMHPQDRETSVFRTDRIR